EIPAQASDFVSLSAGRRPRHYQGVRPLSPVRQRCGQHCASRHFSRGTQSQTRLRLSRRQPGRPGSRRAGASGSRKYCRGGFEFEEARMMKKWVGVFCTALLAVGAMAQDTSVPAGTALKVKLETTLSTFSNKN